MGIRASPIVPGCAYASKNEKWPPPRMQIQTQAKLPLILMTYWLLENVPCMTLLWQVKCNNSTCDMPIEFQWVSHDCFWISSKL